MARGLHLPASRLSLGATHGLPPSASLMRCVSWDHGMLDSWGARSTAETFTWTQMPPHSLQRLPLMDRLPCAGGEA